jgi:hypothetical protein
MRRPAIKDKGEDIARLGPPGKGLSSDGMIFAHGCGRGLIGLRSEVKLR